jgi:putative tricarboxylic transport membrane protein
VRSAQFLLHSAVAAAAFVLAAGGAAAQSWKPEKPVEIIIGTSPGGPQDRTGRLIQKILQEKKLVATPVTVVNRPGGGGAVGLAYLHQHAGDAHYLMINAISLLTNNITGKSKLSYRDFTPIAVMGVEYVGVSVRTGSPIKDGKQLVDMLRKNPASLSVGVGTALGNATHISFALALRAAGVDIKKLRTVVFNSGSETVMSAMGGHTDAAASAPSTVLGQVRAGKMRILAIGAPHRLGGDLAGVPTWKELERFDMVDVYRNSAETGKYWQEQSAEAKEVLTELGLAK